tara:strand:- start:1126 stop:1521 length:396 start_codon:yes stop_codon:yes gene_type:complete
MSKKEIIKTDKAPKAVGSYSQAVFIEGFLFVSGQLPLDRKTMVRVGVCDFDKQVFQCLNNIKHIIHEKNMDLNDIVKLTVFLTDISNFSAVNNVFESFFDNGFYPARSLVEVSKLPKNSDIEIDAICYCGS